MGPRAGLDALEKRKVSCPYWELNHVSGPAHSVVTVLTMLSWLQNAILWVFNWVLTIGCHIADSNGSAIIAGEVQ